MSNYSDDQVREGKEYIRNLTKPEKVSDEGYGIYKIQGLDGQEGYISGYNKEILEHLAADKHYLDPKYGENEGHTIEQVDGKSPRYSKSQYEQAMGEVWNDYAPERVGDDAPGGRWRLTDSKTGETFEQAGYNMWPLMQLAAQKRMEDGEIRGDTLTEEFKGRFEDMYSKTNVESGKESDAFIMKSDFERDLLNYSGKVGDGLSQGDTFHIIASGVLNGPSPELPSVGEITGFGKGDVAATLEAEGMKCAQSTGNQLPDWVYNDKVGNYSHTADYSVYESQGGESQSYPTKTAL